MHSYLSNFIQPVGISYGSIHSSPPTSSSPAKPGQSSDWILGVYVDSKIPYFSFFAACVGLMSQLDFYLKASL